MITIVLKYDLGDYAMVQLMNRLCNCTQLNQNKQFAVACPILAPAQSSYSGNDSISSTEFKADGFAVCNYDMIGLSSGM